MVRVLIAVCLLAPRISMAQPLGVVKDDKNWTLQERYVSMKIKAETYQEYKVIKEYVMDGVWKIAMDSLKGQKLTTAKAHQTISQLETDLHQVQQTLADERGAATQMVHDSTHISVMGVDLRKNVFIILFAAVLTAVFFAVSGMITRIKLLQSTAKEKIVIADLLTRELDEFRRKAMDKQIKLARELQNERNKLAELKDKRIAN
jgi:hypothetical protein